MHDYRELEEKKKDTDKVMENLKVLLKVHSITKKELEEALKISSGYLTRLSSPKNNKNMSLDLQIMIENYFGVPTLELQNHTLKYPNNEDEFMIKVIDKLIDETVAGKRSWEEIKYKNLVNDGFWDALFSVRVADDNPFKGNKELIRKIDSVPATIIMPGSLYETYLEEDKKIVLFRTGVDTGDYEVDEDIYGSEFAYRILDWKYEILMQTIDGKYRSVVDTYAVNVKLHPILEWTMLKLYDVVASKSEDVEKKETMDILAKFLDDKEE